MNCKRLVAVLKAHGEWADAMLIGETAAGKLKHLKEEVDEVLTNPDDTEEWADCFILLFDALRKHGISFDAVLAAMEAKLVKNKRRRWEETEPGMYHHVKETVR